MWYVTSGELECHGRSKLFFIRDPIQSYFESRRPLLVTAWGQYGSSVGFLVALQPVHGDWQLLTLPSRLESLNLVYGYLSGMYLKIW